MRKTLTLLTVLMLFIFAAHAQSRTITGKVIDSTGKPVSGVSVQVKGTGKGTTGSSEGIFSILANTGDVLVISEINYGSTEVTVGNQSNLSVTLSGVGNSLSEVVVTTAFGVKREQRTTPFSAQVVTSESLNLIPQTNVNDALAGKVAGVQFRSQSGTKLNSQTFTRIRGGSLLSGDVNPIYVVDGTIINDSYDIDPNTIESINVLKGANATALFGSRAISGAIVITTLKATKGQTSIDVNQGVTFDKVSKLPKLQNSFAGGGSANLIPFTWEEGMPEEWKALDGKAYPDYTDDASWGPKMQGQEYIPWYAWVPGSQYSFKTASLTPQPDNIRDFWRTGVNANTSLNFYSSGKGYSTRISYSHIDIKGLIPSSSSVRNILSTSTSIDINKVISAGVDLNYNTQKLLGEYDDGYANQSAGNFGQWNHRDLDMGIMKELRNLRTPAGTLASWNWASNPAAYDPGNPAAFYSGNYWYNFYSYQDNINLDKRSDRLFGDVYLNFKFSPHFNVRGTIRKDQSDYYYENITRSIIQSSGAQTGLKASYGTGQRYQNEINYELIATYNNRFFNNDFGVNVLAGGNIFTYLRRDLDNATVNGLIINDLYSLANSASNPTVTNSRLGQRINSYFASGDFEYKKFISASWALRQDYASTLPVGNNGLFYPSAGFAFIPSEFTKGALPWLSFAKVYGSWGKKPLTLDIYAVNFSYPINSNKFNGNVLQSTSNTIPANDLAGALITSYEAGVELRFLKSRIGLTANYYNETIGDQPVTIQLPGQSGFTASTINAATVKKQGLEFVFDAKIVSNKNFSWTVTKSLGYLIKNPVTKIIEGTDRIQPSSFVGASFGGFYQASAYQVLNQDWGQLIGGGMVRNDAGAAVIDPTTGLYVQGDPNKEWGSIVPKLTGGLQSLLQYKNFSLNASLDYQFGGHFYSLTEMWGYYSGLLEETASQNDRGSNVRDALSDGGGVHVVGVSSTDNKTPVDMYVDGYTYFHQFTSVMEPFVHKLSYIKLREVSLGYTIPTEKINLFNGAIKRITLSVVARNPWLIYSASKNFDPSEISNAYGEDGQLPPVRSLGFNVKFNF